MWTKLDSQSAIDQLLTRFGGFHDACLRELYVVTETYVAKDLAMSCPGELDTSATLFFQSQNRRLSAIEVKCERVTAIRLRPTAEGCDSIVIRGTITSDGASFRLAVNFIGVPLTGPPNSGVWMPERSTDDPDLEVSAQVMAWRPLDDALGPQLRYRPADPKRRRAVGT